jgi:GT2 family glycosyltransferase
MPKLSILVPTCNRAAYLRECLDSLLTTTVDCEVIVSDNASSDETRALMRTYTDPRVRYYRQAENMGVINNHNFLLAVARGDYICIFGDDDRAVPGSFERKVAMLDAFAELDMVYSQSYIIDAEGQRHAAGAVMGRLPFSYVGGRTEFDDLLLNCYISWQTLIFRRSLYEEVGPLELWGLRASNDWHWLQHAVRGRQVGFLNEPTVEVRVHDTSISATAGTRLGHFMEDRLDIWHKWLLESEHPPTIGPLMAGRMSAVLLGEVAGLQGTSAESQAPYIERLNALFNRYAARLEERARIATAGASAPRHRPGEAPALSVLVRPGTGALLEACVESLLNSEVGLEVLVSAGAAGAAVEALRARYGADPRLRLLDLPPTAGVTALAAEARGRYICLMRDDVLAMAGGLETKVAWLEQHPQLDLVYSRWCQADAGGGVAIALQPGRLYYSHVGERDAFADLLLDDPTPLAAFVARRAVVEAAGEPAPGLTAASVSDWELALRWSRGRRVGYWSQPTVALCTPPALEPAVTDERLAVWRTYALAPEAPPLLGDPAWQRMLEVLIADVVAAYGDNRARIQRYHDQLFHLRAAYNERAQRRAQQRLARAPLHAPGEPTVACSLIVPMRNQAEQALRCLEALIAHTPGELFEVVVVDNGSDDATPVLLAQLEGDVKILRNRSDEGPARACNMGAERASGRYLAFLEPDLLPTAGWLEALLAEIASAPDIGLAAPKLVSAASGLVLEAGIAEQDGRLIAIGQGLPPDADALAASADRECVSASGLLVRAELFRELGGFNQASEPGGVALEFCDCARAAGWRIRYAAASALLVDEPAEAALA